MGKIIQLLSCLYLYDSGIQVPVHIKKQSWYTGFRRQALTYRSASIPASDTTGKFAQSRYTGFQRHREACAKLVYRLPTSKGLREILNATDWNSIFSGSVPVDDMWCVFENVLWQVIESTVPTKSVRCNVFLKPMKKNYPRFINKLLN